jgi:signal transduction histidine kinase
MALTRDRSRRSKQNASARKPTAKRIDQVTALLHQLDSMRDQERKLLARELHDTLVASLSATKLECDWLLRAQQPSEALSKQRLSRMSASLMEAIQFTRTVIDRLWPVAVQHLGLVAALQALLCAIDPGFADAKRPEVEGDVEELPETHALALYRAVEDLLKQQLKAAAPARAELAIRRAVSGVELRLDLSTDAGGSVLQSPPSGGLALERISYLGGEYLLTANERGGVHLRLLLPLPSPKTNPARSGER